MELSLRNESRQKKIIKNRNTNQKTQESFTPYDYIRMYIKVKVFDFFC